MSARKIILDLHLVSLLISLKWPRTLCVDYHSHLYSPYYNNKDENNIWNDALNLMAFHRNKMNEYLCKNYVAREIVKSFQNQTFDNNLNRRVREPLSSRSFRESLLKDTGSEKYKDWLSRSSTLEDIYRQFDHSEDEHKEAMHGDMYHDGINGYTFVDSKHIYSKPVDYGIDNHYHFGHHEDEHFGTYHEEEHHDEKGIKLKELFHFALTAIAFLAFATFMVEIIVCLMDAQGSAPDYVIVPTNTGTAAGLKNEFEALENTRQERSLQLDPVSIEILNEISSKVLSSIEAMAILYEDGGQCLQRILCENTKYSKNLPGSQKIWLPIWSFGTSWIGGKMSKSENSSANRALKYLLATVLGLGTKECYALYPNCDNKLRRKKK